MTAEIIPINRRVFLGLLAAAGAAAALPETIIEHALAPSNRPDLENGDVLAMLRPTMVGNHDRHLERWLKIGNTAEVRTIVEHIERRTLTRLEPEYTMGLIRTELSLVPDGLAGDEFMRSWRVPIRIYFGDFWFTHEAASPRARIDDNKGSRLSCFVPGMMTMHKGDPALQQNVTGPFTS